MKILIVAKKFDSFKNLSNPYRVGKALASLGHEVKYARPIEASAMSRGNDFILGFGQLLYQKNLRLIPMIANKKNPNTKFAIWSFDSCSEIDEPSRTLNRKIKSILPHVDWLITTDHSYPWEDYVENYLHLFQGVDPDDFNYEPSNNHNRKFDIIYAGGLWNRYEERNRAIKELAKHFKMIIYCSDKHRFNGFPDLEFRNRVFGKDFFNAYQEAKLAYVPRPPSQVKQDYWSNRIYLAGATGTPCITEYVEGMEKEFNQNEVMFADSLENTMKAVFHFLDHPKERQVIGLNARKRILKEYKYTDRAKTLIGAIFG